MSERLLQTARTLELTSGDVLLGLAVSVIAFLGGTAFVSLLLVNLPPTYFCKGHHRDLWIGRHPVIRWTGILVKNLLGILIVIVGVILSMPGVPGPGFLTILIGITLLDFPGKRRLEHWLIRRPRIRGMINRLRQRYHRPPLVLDDLQAERTSTTSRAPP